MNDYPVNKTKWHNPREKIWGFHVHQELPIDDFQKALVIQNECAKFLKKHHVTIDASDAIAPGYGPHLDYMWELRVEGSPKNTVLEKLGLAISYMAINRFGLSAYIHPLMQDPTLPEEIALAAEGRENQANALWFSYRVPQDQAFFFNPPKDDNNRIIDTRTSRVMEEKKKKYLLKIGRIQLKNAVFREPSEVIIHGFHIHLDYIEEQESLALSVFDNFLIYLLGENIRPSSTRLYDPRENGPHEQRGWEVKFETENKIILEQIGIAVAWLMCNRKGLSIFMHPVTWEEGDYSEEHKAHDKYSFFIGDLPTLDLSFFSDKIENEAE
ncbi:MAG: hypothetical protein DHS20C10_05260 [marine bacterium B5-7]|nr:MAG: hypothetical protein DHS20C10_05260 [marine bacterium B5-7]